jgi:hypothetical protein
VTGPRISTITEASPRPGSGDRLAIRGNCFPAGRYVDVYFRSDLSGDESSWVFNAQVVASDGTFTIPMVWRPPTKAIIQTTTNEYVTAYTVESSDFSDYTSNTLVFQVGGTITLH